jgi:hypothetical protein
MRILHSKSKILGAHVSKNQEMVFQNVTPCNLVNRYQFAAFIFTVLMHTRGDDRSLAL